MTKEAKIAELRNIRDHFNYTLAPREVFDDAIKALEQELVIDRVRAEIIAKERNVKTVRSDSCCFFTAEEVLEIIDKHKAESEDT